MAATRRGPSALITSAAAWRCARASSDDSNILELCFTPTFYYSYHHAQNLLPLNLIILMAYFIKKSIVGAITSYLQTSNDCLPATKAFDALSYSELLLEPEYFWVSIDYVNLDSDEDRDLELDIATVNKSHGRITLAKQLSKFKIATKLLIAHSHCYRCAQCRRTSAYTRYGRGHRHCCRRRL